MGAAMGEHRITNAQIMKEISALKERVASLEAHLQEMQARQDRSNHRGDDLEQKMDNLLHIVMKLNEDVASLKVRQTVMWITIGGAIISIAVKLIVGG